jgi:hypothetical protein
MGRSQPWCVAVNTSSASSDHKTPLTRTSARTPNRYASQGHVFPGGCVRAHRMGHCSILELAWNAHTTRHGLQGQHSLERSYAIVTWERL